MKTERELFEAWFESEYLNCKISEIIDHDDYWFPIIEFSWESWQASANHEGFVLVPFEPTQVMCDEGFSELNTYNRDDTPYGVIKNIYQSMIGATNENQD